MAVNVNEGQEMYDFVCKIFPYCRSLTGEVVLCQDLKQIKMRIFHRKINICSLSCIYTII